DNTLQQRSGNATNAELLQDAEVLRNISSSLDAHLQPTIASLNERHNAQLPVGQLPVETLADIFLLSIDDHRDHYANLSRIELVSRRWRHAISISPHFYAVLDSRDLPSVNRRRLELSGTVPLHIVVVDVAGQPLQSFVDLVKQESRRWESCIIDSKQNSALIYPFRDLFTPNLRDLRLTRVWGPFMRDDGDTPLRHLRLQRCSAYLPLALNSPAFSHLESLHLDNHASHSWKAIVKYLSTSRLTSLYLNYISIHEDASPVVGRRTPDEHPVLTRLRRLQLGTLPLMESRMLLSHIEAPECKLVIGDIASERHSRSGVFNGEAMQQGLVPRLLESANQAVIRYSGIYLRIRIEHRFPQDPTIPPRQLIDAYIDQTDTNILTTVLASNSITRVSLQLCSVTRDPDYATILRSPNITSIYVRPVNHPRNIMNALAEHDDTGWRCPRLQDLRLVFSYLPSLPSVLQSELVDLVDLVQKRWGSAHPKPEIASITVLLDGSHPSTLPLALLEESKKAMELANQYVPTTIEEWECEPRWAII
ncbi:hypothetical protein FRB99_000917, partial [Tulasnella sp. 403]